MSVETLKSRKGVWLRPGRSGPPETPGSYAKYILVRAPPAPYARTDQQRRIAEAGRQVGKECKGKTGTEFRACRTDILASIRKQPAK